MIKHNRIKCLRCFDIIESKHRHDMVWCKCGKCATDGGTAYLRRCFEGPSEEAFEELSECVPSEMDNPALGPRTNVPKKRTKSTRKNKNSMKPRTLEGGLRD